MSLKHLTCMRLKLPFIHWEFILCLTTENSIIQQETVGILGNKNCIEWLLIWKTFWGIYESCTHSFNVILNKSGTVQLKYNSIDIMSGPHTSQL